MEAREVINIPALSWDNSLPEQEARRKSDSLKKNAASYILRYEQAKAVLASVSRTRDSLQSIYAQSMARVRAVQQLANRRSSSFQQLKELAADPVLKANGIKLVPGKYQWLMGIRKFSAGRSPLNYSELTAKNISIKGVNFEYNTWFYAAVAAGVLDYRFRDFVIRPQGRPKQYFLLTRLGIGQVEKNFLIASFYKGNKQVFTSGAAGNLYSLNIAGISLEGRYQFNKNIYVQAEIAESRAPDFRFLPLKNTSWNLKDKTDKAFAVGLHFRSLKLQTNLDASYKYTGANFQSFSSFQTNSSLKTWNVKLEQFAFRKQLKLTATARSNEFSNPYIVQTYKSNLLFKSVQASFRKKGWPVLTAGFLPVSQLTNVNGVIMENRFNTAMGSMYHMYKLGKMKTASTVMYSRFYNSTADSSFLYFDAKNIFVTQQFFLDRFNSTVAITHSRNRNYTLSVMDGNLDIPVLRALNLLVGVKISNLNNQVVKNGHYGGLRFPVYKKLQLSMSYEVGYIPGFGGTLISNNTGIMQLSKSF